MPAKVRVTWDCPGCKGRHALETDRTDAPSVVRDLLDMGCDVMMIEDAAIATLKDLDRAEAEAASPFATLWRLFR